MAKKCVLTGMTSQKTCSISHFCWESNRPNSKL